MLFSPPLQQSVLLRRYKRFLADVELPSGEQITMHCPNTGSMTQCVVEGTPCWYSTSDNKTRKYAHTLEVVTTATGHLTSIYTGRANNLVREAIASGVLTELSGYEHSRSEVKYGSENSRIDLLLSQEGRPDCYVEVKTVTLGMESGEVLFPDAVSQRGSKHLRELVSVVQQGGRAVMVFCVQHTGILSVAPADAIDPVYGRTLREAIAAGVEVVAYQASITPAVIQLTSAIPVYVGKANHHG